MRTVNGYVFIPKFENNEFRPMFGPKEIDDKSNSYSNFVTNNLTPFDTLGQTKSSSLNFRGAFKRVNRIDIGKIALEIAENIEEIREMKERDQLILIGNPMKGDPYLTTSPHELYGPITTSSNLIGVVPFQQLSVNGYTPWKKEGNKDRSPFDRAMYALEELNRQGQRPGTLATFSLTYY